VLQIAFDVKREIADCDLVIVTLHGGHEMYSYPTPRLRKLCRSLADMGADAVFNCHTHCPLGYEIYNDVPIIYSPGNFYFPNRPTSLPCWYLGYLPKFFFDENGAYALELLPYFNYKEALTLLDEADTEKFFAYLDELTAPIADEARLQKLFDAWCTRSGINGYFGQLFNRAIPESFQLREGVKKNLGLRNLFTCQSHHDLLRNTLLLMERYQLEEAKELIPLINAAQNPPWVKIAENQEQ
jgi:poly-gamma-glutamate synthesis protein (capsule biosynthesis protein)